MGLTSSEAEPGVEEGDFENGHAGGDAMEE